MKNFVVVGYYTAGTIYEEYARNLVHSCEAQGLAYKVCPITEGDWDKATHYKPTFLRKMIDEMAPAPIVYVDADAVFLRPPVLFEDLATKSHVHVAAHLLDHNLYRRKGTPPEILSGTVYLGNTPQARLVLEEWINVCRSDSKLWDQVALQRVVEKHGYYDLPPEYCVIFDYMASVQDPVIKHFQASRAYKASALHRRRNASGPRRVVQNGVVKIRRIHD